MSTNKNLFVQLTKNLTENLKKPFILLPNGFVFHYQDMLHLSGSYANALSALGIKKGDRILVQATKKVECIWLYLACLRIGAIFITINPEYNETETNYFLADCEPSLFVSTKKNINVRMINSNKRYKGVKIKTLNRHEDNSIPVMASTRSGHFNTLLSKNDETAAILYTSGTTGKSKGAMISHYNLFSNAKTLAEIWHISSNDTLLHILPIYHTHGLFVAINSIIYAGGSILFHRKFNAEVVIDALPATTMLMAVPTHYNRLLAEKKLSKKVARKVRLFISGSAPLSSEVHKRFKKVTGASILERYGMTETNMITSNPYYGPRKPGTVGIPLPNVKVRIRKTETDELAEQGTIGQIEVKGPNVFSGYWQLPERNQVDFKNDGFFLTGDLGYFDADGYLNISGREKDLIISGGLNVYPAEVEKVINSLPEIYECALIGAPHPDFGEGVTAVITLNDPEISFDERDMKSRLNSQIANYKVPKKIIVVENLPKNTMGKVQKHLLRTKFKNIYSTKA